MCKIKCTTTLFLCTFKMKFFSQAMRATRFEEFVREETLLAREFKVATLLLMLIWLQACQAFCFNASHKSACVSKIREGIYSF